MLAFIPTHFAYDPLVYYSKMPVTEQKFIYMNIYIYMSHIHIEIHLLHVLFPLGEYGCVLSTYI